MRRRIYYVTLGKIVRSQTLSFLIREMKILFKLIFIHVYENALKTKALHKCKLLLSFRSCDLQVKECGQFLKALLCFDLGS